MRADAWAPASQRCQAPRWTFSGRYTPSRKGRRLPHGARASAGPPSGSWPSFLSSLFVAGAAGGTLLDGIHSRVGLQVYQWYPVAYGGLLTSLAVPPLLGAFYAVLGSLFVILDAAVSDTQTSKAQDRSRDFAVVAASFGLLAAELQLSVSLYSNDCPFGTISAVLAAVSISTWAVLDRTRQGALLSGACAIGAPLAELLLLRMEPLWSYPRSDLDLGALGCFVSWVPWCYFCYTPVLGVLARYLWQARKDVLKA